MATDVFRYLQENQSEIVADIERFVKAESPTLDKTLTDRCGEVLADLFRCRLGLEAVRIPQREIGDCLRLEYGEGESQLLVLSHFDTVWEAGRLSYRVEDGKAYGPGILDMKGGIVQSIWALKALLACGMAPSRKIVFLCTTDEEIGSPHTRGLIEQESLRSDAVLVPEPPIARTGALKTARKSTGRFTVRIQGKAAHAGNHPEDGVSAVEEMARQIIGLHALTDYSQGTTVNVGVASGGTRLNIVAERAEMHIDVRVITIKEAERVSAIISSLKPQLPGAAIQVEGGMTRPPMERNAHTERLFQLASQCAGELGFELKEG
ncbi:MAG: putative peptidase family protein, partial [Paenibacillus sp.]|nr:putative peptidase family protein [Paenibacillus sp.]